MYKVRIPLAPMRVSPSHKAEMCNELLYGEKVEKLDQIKEWAEVSCIDYEYRGWILADAIEETTVAEGNAMLFSETGKIEALDYPMTIYRGSVLREEVLNSGDAYEPAGEFDAEALLSIARQYINAPYRWGGRSPMGLDCSGFTQMVFKLSGIQLPRDAGEQAGCGQSVSFIQESKVGDLAFFGDSEYSITHVGIILNQNEIIHASGRVRIDKIDHEGIFNSETGKYSHKLRIIKRI